MKRANILGAVLMLAGGACGEPEEEVEIAPIGEPTATVTVPGAVPSPLHGGTVLMAGERPVEVVADEEGTINAYYLGTPPSAPQDARVTVRVPDADGQVRPVLLTWNPGESRYTGLLRGARPAPGPIELVLVLAGETTRATAPTFVLLEPAARAAAAVVRAPARPEVVVERPSAPNVVIEAPAPPRPSVVVHAPTPPRPSVVVHAPTPPRPRVVVHAPAPPQPRVVVRAPRPPQPRVVVRAPAPPQPRVVVQPAPRPRVIVRERDDGRRGRRRGHGHGDRNHDHRHRHRD